jgi:phenylalanyl-tRNA synthetase beta chain
MLISYNWLLELTNTRLTPLELRDRLTMVGLAIDAVDQHASDSVLDVEVPSNRPDCLSHVGVAREVTVIDNGKLSLPAGTTFRTEGKASDLTAVEIVDQDLCPRYAARLIRGVKIGPSPEWLVQRLETIGQRPINNVADIPNYVLHELGQPLHAFDFQKLSGKRIVVRRAAPAEKLKTLDGVERELTSDMLVIADAERPVALAGIMGGEESEISATTTDVLIESAYFDPDSIRKTARRLGMDTEASRRFERGADCGGMLRAQQRCVELICQLAGGEATEDAIDVYPRPLIEREVTLYPNRVEALTSLRVESEEIKRILGGLGFELKAASDSALQYKVPSWRVDVQQEEDLVEDVARHSGYEKIASELAPSSLSGEYQPTELKQRSLRRALNSCGFDEAISLSFIQQHTELDLIPAFSGREEMQPELQNPIIEDASWMRSSLLPGLLGAVRHNLNHGIRDLSLFEIGKVFASSKQGELPEERLALAVIITGGAIAENRAVADREVDFFDLKGALETAVDWMGLSQLVYTKGEAKHLRLGQASAVSLETGERVGFAGRLSEAIASGYKFRQPVFVAELDLSAVLAGPVKTVHYVPLARYPSVVRDISLLLDRNIQLEEILRAVDKEAVTDCKGAKLVGVYEGANIQLDKRSVTVRIEYRSDERTLKDEEVEERHVQLTSSLLRSFSAEQR